MRRAHRFPCMRSNVHELIVRLANVSCSVSSLVSFLPPVQLVRREFPRVSIRSASEFTPRSSCYKTSNLDPQPENSDVVEHDRINELILKFEAAEIRDKRQNFLLPAKKFLVPADKLLARGAMKKHLKQSIGWEKYRGENKISVLGRCNLEDRSIMDLAVFDEWTNRLLRIPADLNSEC